MNKSKLFTALTLIFAVLAIVSTITLARTAYAAGDDVFMDEGDGDFDQVPSVPVTDVEKPKATKKAKHEVKEVVPEIVDTPEAPLLVDDSAAPTPPAPTDEVAPPVSTPKEKKSKKKSKKKAEKTAAVPKAENPATEEAATPSAGSFVVTKEACSMMRSPASTGEPMLTVKASKKIWVEPAGDGWVKGWNKAGEPGYIAKDCLK